MDDIQILSEVEIRSVAGGTGIEGRVGVLYQSGATGKLYRWDPVGKVMAEAGTGGGSTTYDPPTLNPNNIAVTFIPPSGNTTVTSTIAIARTFTGSVVYHYNINRNSTGELLSISAWGAGATGSVGGY